MTATDQQTRPLDDFEEAPQHAQPNADEVDGDDEPGQATVKASSPDPLSADSLEVLITKVVLLKFEWVSSCHIDQLLSVN